jgi:hypothetical protein
VPRVGGVAFASEAGSTFKPMVRICRVWMTCSPKPSSHENRSAGSIDRPAVTAGQ